MSDLESLGTYPNAAQIEFALKVLGRTRFNAVYSGGSEGEKHYKFVEAFLLEAARQASAQEAPQEVASLAVRIFENSDYSMAESVMYAIKDSGYRLVKP